MKELYNKYKEIINYVIVGGLTTVVSLAVYYALVLTVLNPDNRSIIIAGNCILDSGSNFCIFHQPAFCI